ncbi:hypothetical protein OL548_28040 [Lysinibacillus sp. MHQ-1]|nr:hypothetical protein OL548_28040 [Lysinibacillus sp. MHQ-1]
MNKLEQTTKDLLGAGYSIEEIKTAFEELIEQANKPTLITGQITKKRLSVFFACTFST